MGMKNNGQRYDRNEAARQKLAAEKNKIDEGHPVNKFLNAFTDDKKFKYAYSEKLRRYFLNNPDPIFDTIRQINALVHEIRHHKLMSEKCLRESMSDSVITIRNKDGALFERNELYSLFVVESQTVHLVLSKIRSMLINNLLSKVDGEVFTFDQFDKYVGEIDKVVKDLGFDLFPLKVEVISPL